MTDCVCLQSWTTDLQARLHYDRDYAEKVLKSQMAFTDGLQHDDGVFWIDWSSVKQFYDVAYSNWNPDLFKHRYSVHGCWNQVQPMQQANAVLPCS